MSVFTVVGARPQFVKAAVVSRAIAETNGAREFLVHTGQHFDRGMSDVFFEEMQIPAPAESLGIGGLSHGAMVGRMLEEIEKLIIREKPDIVVVYGDTNSTLAGALAAAKMHIPVAHVEAGLRSFDMSMPEEVNRILTDRLSQLLLCPTENAVENLNRESVQYRNDCQVSMVGDVMLDAVRFYLDRAKSSSTIINDLALESGQYCLATLHRQENTDSPSRLAELVTGINELHQKHPVVLPLHPRTKKCLKQMGLELACITVDPIGYFDMLALIDGCGLVLTDSGGLQKEACFLGQQCVTLRDTTEWTELLELDANVLVGADRKKIIEESCRRFGQGVAGSSIPYGDGTAGTKITDLLIQLQHNRQI